MKQDQTFFRKRADALDQGGLGGGGPSNGGGTQRRHRRENVMQMAHQKQKKTAKCANWAENLHTRLNYVTRKEKKKNSKNEEQIA